MEVNPLVTDAHLLVRSIH